MRLEEIVELLQKVNRSDFHLSEKWTVTAYRVGDVFRIDVKPRQ